MKLSTRNDIEAPIDFAFGQFSDFSTLERQAIRRGVKLERVSPLADAGVGTRWVADVTFRGKTREVEFEITEFDRPERIAGKGHSAGLDLTFTVDLVSLSPKRTRVIVGIEMRPRTLSARIVLQSVKLAKSSVQSRFNARIEKACKYVSSRYDAAAVS